MNRDYLPHVAIFAASALLSLPTISSAVPAFVRQTGMSCAACHSDFPGLTETGRNFKLNGYTKSADESQWPPLSFMVQGGFTHTKADVPGGPAEHFSKNDNLALGQVSVFYTGPLFGPYADSLFGAETAAFLNKIGVFIQATYDGVGREISWDNAEIRYADKATIFGKKATWGLYLNNNPTLSDPWQTLPAWGFPYSGSPLTEGPGAATMIDEGFAQQVIGLGAYTMINEKWYIDIAGYRTLGAGFQTSLGVDPTDETLISGLAPYWRLAYNSKVKGGTWEFGTFGMAASAFPGRDKSEGKDRTVDFGLDSQYQTSFGNNNLLAMLTWTHETANYHASKALGNTSNDHDNLWKIAATLDVLHDKTYGAALQYFVTDGSNDVLLHGDKGSPYSDGVVAELNWLPFHKTGGPAFAPQTGLKISLQYVMYNHFNGTSDNASDNNALFLGAWLNF